MWKDARDRAGGRAHDRNRKDGAADHGDDQNEKQLKAHGRSRLRARRPCGARAGVLRLERQPDHENDFAVRGDGVQGAFVELDEVPGDRQAET